jgi:hypothetical protein
MPFDFIDGLKDKNWTRIDHKWLARLMKHLKKAQSSNIKQIRFIRHIGRLDIYDNSREYEIQQSCGSCGFCEQWRLDICKVSVSHPKCCEEASREDI